MSGSIPHGLRLPLAALATAIAAWWLLPGSGIDRSTFTTSARAFANPPFFITGNGTHADPWKLRLFSSNTMLTSTISPAGYARTVIRLDDV